jgi:predicted secreted protein
MQQQPTITSQPTSRTVTAGQTATFTVAASGNPAPTFQWQISTNNGSTWVNISGATSTTLTLSNTTVGQNGNRYRAIATNSAGSVTSNAAILTVNSEQLPCLRCGVRGCTNVNCMQSPFIFTDRLTTATSENIHQVTLTEPGRISLNFHRQNLQSSWQWNVQLLDTMGEILLDVNFLANEAVSNSANRYLSAGTYFVRVRNPGSSGSVVIDVDYTLTVNYTQDMQQQPTITSQPTSRTVTAGQTATFTVAASGNPVPTFQWQVSTNNGSTWVNISGATSATLTLSNTTVGQNGNRYRARATNSAGSVTSNAAILTVNPETTLLPIPACATCNLCKSGNPPVKGRVLGNTNSGIFDALEVLKSIVGMATVINDCGNALSAALIVPTRATPNVPNIFDALEVLKFIVGMTSLAE